MDIDEFILYGRKRGDCYRLLSACFYLPKKELFLEEHLFKNLSVLFKSICPEAVSFSDEMEKSLQQYNNEELAIEYAKLFVGPYELEAPPYGSVYLDKERRVMGDSTMEVIKMYHEKGLSMDEDFKELPDHIAVELEFMNYLIYKMLDACMNSKFEEVIDILKDQQFFLKKYLGAWISDFSKAIIENSNNSFYTNLARCTEGFIKTDMDHISKTIRRNDEPC